MLDFTRFPVLQVLAAVALLLAVGASATACAGDDRAVGQDDVLRVDDLIDTVSREVSVFYPSADIIAEERVVLPSEEEMELATLRLLFAAEPEDEDVLVTLPPAAVNSVTIFDGTATVDFSRDVLVTTADVKTQQVALIAILYTLGQFHGVERVAFSVEGLTSGSIDGLDVAEFWGDVTLHDMPWSVMVTDRTEQTAANTEGE